MSVVRKAERLGAGVCGADDMIYFSSGATFETTGNDFIGLIFKEIMN